jgi:alkanesulfonate monooxygenase SsuD/methylene tetrahydromethanopterin reductase-like flavin-dependent oxidoreductase (luciferase family)
LSKTNTIGYYPKPAHKPHPPVLLGGHAPTGLQRVARYADEWLPHRITPHEVEASRKRLPSLAAERGWDPASLTIAVFGQPPDTIREQVDAFRNAGAVCVAVWPSMARRHTPGVSHESAWQRRWSGRRARVIPAQAGSRAVDAGAGAHVPRVPCSRERPALDNPEAPR